MLALAIDCSERATASGDEEQVARALALQGQVAMHRGAMRSALALALRAERALRRVGDPSSGAQSEVAVLQAQLSYFTGAYAHALSNLERAVSLADASNELDLQIFVRRGAVLVLGNVNAPGLERRLEELLAMTVAAGDVWERALTYNDIAVHRESSGALDEARQAIERAHLLAAMTHPNRFALAVIHATCADIELSAGDPAAALIDAERSLELLAGFTQPNPYVLGASVRSQVVARMRLGEYDQAKRAGESALRLLGERMPHTRSMILAAVAAALHGAGRPEEAYDALLRSAALEREAFAEISELRLRLDGTVAEMRRARVESDALAAKNRDLERAHAELERRARQLEQLQEQLLDQADRDWLTGVHNRRYLARELAKPAGADGAVPLSVAVVDLDHFKQVNDCHGHTVGDRVLVRAVELLCGVLRASDTVVRSGGEEFLVMMPDATAEAASRCGERIRQAIAQEPWEQIAPGLRLTASIGVATTETDDDLEPLVKLANKRLYAAKRAGRDRVVIA